MGGAVEGLVSMQVLICASAKDFGMLLPQIGQVR